MTEIRFDNRVAIVTGAGGGLGRAHALLLASRGARVVVNDLGGAIDGSGGDQSAADQVVAEIKAEGGDAVASYDGVDTWDGGQRIVETALKNFGRVDIVVNNAGILRDSSFKKLTEQAWEDVIRVHLSGTAFVSRAAFPAMIEGQFGRIINTSSAAGLYGNFGQSNYGAAKLGIVGLTKTLAQEGAKYNIKANAIAPIAKSRMTETMLPPPVLEKLLPEFVSPLVAYLASEQCEASGETYAVGGGYHARVALVEAPGVRIDTSEGITPESVAAQWAEVNDLSGAVAYTNAMEAAAVAMKDLA